MSEIAPFESSIAERFHEETKYSEDGMRRDQARHGAPDPARQPVPFKDLAGPRIPLPTQGIPITRQGGAPATVQVGAPRGRMDLGKLSRLLWYTNGCTGYVPTAEAMAEGGYEAADSFRWYGTLALAPEAGERMAAAALRLLRSLV